MIVKQASLLATSVYLVTSACAVPDEPAPSINSATLALNSGFTAMQFVGHEDDDTLFMNPDLQNFIGAGYGTVTVVTTAGEAEGTLTESWPGCPAPAPQGRFVYAHRRQDGMRAAYAQMAGLPNVWNRGAYNINGRLIEIDALQGAAHIQLIFLNLPDGGDTLIGGKVGCSDSVLGCLYERVGDPSFPTIPPVLTERPGDAFPASSDLGIPSYEYNREFLVADLLALLNAYHPSVVRVLDPHPYERITNNMYAVAHDNNDHSYTARFVGEALQQYSGAVQTLFYQTYSIADQPANLGVGERQRKTDSFNAYMGTGTTTYDGNAKYLTCKQAATSNFGGYVGWPLRTFERYPATTSWLTTLADGRLAAFAVLGRQLTWWSEVTVGGAWTASTPLGGGPLAPAIATATKPNGDLVVVALQKPDSQDAAFPAAGTTPLNIVYNVRSATAGTWAGWQSLGNPDAGAAASACSAPKDAYGRWLGTPGVAVDSAGSIVVAARSSCGHVSVRSVVGGVAQPTWTSLALPIASEYDVLDGIALIQADDGRVHIFASTMQRWIAHWVQTASGATTYGADTANFPVGSSLNVASAPTVTKNQDGRLEVFWRGETTGNVITKYQLSGTGWGQTDLGNTGSGGTGPIAAIRRPSGHIMVFARNGFDGVSANWQGTINSSFGATWTDLQGQTPTFPSAATDANGLVTVGHVSLEGQLRIRRETAGVGSFGPWVLVGNP